MKEITDKQKCIAEQSVYGDLKALYLGEVIDIAWAQEKSIYVRNLDHTDSYYTHPANIELILRPISDLTKKIKHKGYNDDKPFVPLVELAKVAQNTTKSDHFKLVNDTVVDFTIAYHFKQNVMWFQSLQDKKQVYILPNQNSFFDLLHLWHFDTRNLIKKGEAIDVNTLLNDPYAADKKKIMTPEKAVVVPPLTVREGFIK